MAFHTIPDPEAQNNLNDFLKTSKAVNWRTTSAKPVYSIKNESIVGKPVKVVGYIHSIFEPKPIEIDKKRLTYVQMSINDRSNDQIAVLPIYNDEIQKSLKNSFLHKHLCTFHGTVLSIISKDQAEYIFYLENFLPEVSAEDLIELQHGLRTERANIFIKEIATQTDKFKYFKNRIVNGLGIKSLETIRQMFRDTTFVDMSYGACRNIFYQFHTVNFRPFNNNGNRIWDCLLTFIGIKVKF